MMEEPRSAVHVAARPVVDGSKLLEEGLAVMKYKHGWWLALVGVSLLSASNGWGADKPAPDARQVEQMVGKAIDYLRFSKVRGKTTSLDDPDSNL